MEDKNTKKTIIVPWDFTEVAENALIHAIKFAKIADCEIKLLHIGKENDEVISKLNETCISNKNNCKVEISWLVKDGSIFNMIKDTAEEMDALLVVMGTHGIKGMQKLTGSKALKVIADSVVPFIVVQQAPSKNPFAKIVCPIDFTVENKEKLKWAHFIGVYFKTKLHLYLPYVSDPVLIRKTKANLLYAKNYLDERGIEYEIAAAQNKGKFSELTVDYANEINAGLVLIMTKKDIGIADFVFGSDEQQIIANNAHIPVMCINPRTDIKKFKNFY